MNVHSLSTPKAIAERGEEIYREDYQASYERDHSGKFVAVDVITKQAYLGDTPEAALDLAKGESPMGIFHLIQIGFPAAFRVSYSSHAATDWIFQQ